jgi:hypothetical protein
MRDRAEKKRISGWCVRGALLLLWTISIALEGFGCSGGGATPETSCEASGVCPHGSSAGSQGGGGGAPPVECKQRADCAQPDPRCGSVTCISGVCVPSIKAGPTASQLRGDCLRTECDAAGQVVTVPDESDVYDDGRICTTDLCTPTGPANEMVPLDTPCPGGACVNYWCLECLSEWSCSDPSHICITAHKCTPSKCISQKYEPEIGETDLDCGGPCAPCEGGKKCAVSGDCTSGICKNGDCTYATCYDGVKNAVETDIDCGLPDCIPCADGRGCVMPGDCTSGVCWAGVCQAPACFDGTKNGSETGVDCGGPCGACP